MPERVRGHALALVHSGRLDAVPEHSAELGVVESASLHPDEDGLLGKRNAGREYSAKSGASAEWIGIVRRRPPFVFLTGSSRRERPTSSQSSPSSSLRRSPA